MALSRTTDNEVCGRGLFGTEGAIEGWSHCRDPGERQGKEWRWVISDFTSRFFDRVELQTEFEPCIRIGE